MEADAFLSTSWSSRRRGDRGVTDATTGRCRAPPAGCRCRRDRARARRNDVDGYRGGPRRRVRPEAAHSSPTSTTRRPHAVRPKARAPGRRRRATHAFIIFEDDPDVAAVLRGRDAADHASLDGRPRDRCLRLVVSMKMCPGIAFGFSEYRPAEAIPANRRTGRGTPTYSRAWSMCCDRYEVAAFRGRPKRSIEPGRRWCLGAAAETPSRWCSRSRSGARRSSSWMPVTSSGSSWAPLRRSGRRHGG